MKRSKQDIQNDMPFFGSKFWRVFKLVVIFMALSGGINAAYWGAGRFVGSENVLAQTTQESMGDINVAPIPEVEPDHSRADVPEPMQVAVGDLEEKYKSSDKPVPQAVKNYAVAQSAFKKNQETLANLLEE